MTKRSNANFGVLVKRWAAAILTVSVFVAGLQSALAADSPTPRASYFPNTEPLGPDEMRIISLGTGTPNFRHSQASASWLVELGNGEKFLFDVGTGSLANLAALEIPYTLLDKVFLTFQDLQTARLVPRGMIPINAIIDYAARYKLDPDTLKRVVWKTDGILLEHWKGVDAAEAAKAKAERDQKGASLGAKS